MSQAQISADETSSSTKLVGIKEKLKLDRSATNAQAAFTLQPPQLYSKPPNTSVYLRRSPVLLGFGFLRRLIYNHPNTISLAANGQSFTRGARGQKKEKEKTFQGFTGESATRTKCYVVFRRSTAVLRTTSDTPTEARTTGQLRDLQLAMVVTCLCVGGPCALPLVRSCSCKTRGALDGLTAAAHQNVRSYDVSF